MPEIIVKLGEAVVQKYSFDKEAMRVGRGRDNDIVLENLQVSRNHAEIRKENDRFVLVDLQSANGTFINGVRVSKTEILDNDVVAIGKHQLQFLLKQARDDQPILPEMDADRTVLMDTAPTGMLIVTRGKQRNQEFVIDRYETLIGKAAECHVKLNDWFVSKQHAVIYRQNNEFSIKDLGRLSGVVVNDQPVREPRKLSDGDVIKIGPVHLRFHIKAEQTGMAPAKPLAGRRSLQMRSGESGYDREVDMGFARMQAKARSIEDGPKPRSPLTFGSEQIFQKIRKEGPAEAQAKSEPADSKRSQAIDKLLETVDSNDAGAIEQELESAEPTRPMAGSEAQDAEDAGSLFQPLCEPSDEPELELMDEYEIASAADGFAEYEAPDAPGAEAQEQQAAAEPAAEAHEDRPAGIAPAPSGVPAADPKKAAEIAMWEKALSNNSPIIRREAAKQLKKLTGIQYDV